MCCAWGWRKDGTRCPDHFCGQPSQEAIDQWIMAEDASPHPRRVWLAARAREVTLVRDPSVQALVEVIGDDALVTLRKPVYGEVWLADTHLTGRTSREVLDWDEVALVTVTHRGEVEVGG